MYEENKSNINWFKIGLRIAIMLLVILLTIKLISLVIENKNTEKQETLMTENIKNLDSVGKKYFEENVPTKTGDSIIITLQELIDKKMIEEIKDADNKVCDTRESFVKITRLDTEYQIKTVLVCNGYDDYVNSIIEIESDEIEIKPTTTTTTTTKKVTTKKKTTITSKTTTTKKITTTTASIKRYEVSFNSNGGKIVKSQKVIENDKAVKVIPTREGYKFVGWYYHGKEFDFNTKINQDYVLTAKWIKE